MRLCVAKVAQFCANGASGRADSAPAEKFFSGQIGRAQRVFAIAACITTGASDDECDARVISIRHSRGAIARATRDGENTSAGRIFACSASIHGRSRGSRRGVFVYGRQDV
jgi:hypothetical protein